MTSAETNAQGQLLRDIASADQCATIPCWFYAYPISSAKLHVRTVEALVAEGLFGVQTLGGISVDQGQILTTLTGKLSSRERVLPGSGMLTLRSTAFVPARGPGEL